MNLTSAQKVRLGVFVASGAALFVAGTVTLAGLKTWQRLDRYTVRFKESVSGLEKSSQVRYQGLRVGRVEKMRVAPDDPSTIEVTLALKPDTVLHEGATAVLDTSGITGLKTINLTPGDPRKGPLEPGSELPAGVSFVDRITGEAESISVKVEIVANQLTRWTSDENRIRFEALLDALTSLSKHTDDLVRDIKKPAVSAAEELAKTGASVRSFTSEGAVAMKELNGTLKATRLALNEAERIMKAVDSESVHETLHATRSAMTQLDARVSKAELGATIVKLRSALQEVTDLLQQTDVAVRAGREDFVTSMAHVREATEDLREFSRIIAQDPSALLRGKELGE